MGLNFGTFGRVFDPASNIPAERRAAPFSLGALTHPKAQPSTAWQAPPANPNYASALSDAQKKTGSTLLGG